MPAERCLKLGRIPDAVEAGRRAVRLRPRDARTLVQLGWALLWQVWAKG
ncbi:MAG: hypothetical protein HY721_09635, partial [Planctomycetes bacterium]|nr:hypothetical protein [Planctomycetota bacterium]